MQKDETYCDKDVSVVMCTYNGAKYLREQLDSIISQTYPIYELIIQDDSSTDETICILNEYEEKYSFMHVYQNEKQKGINCNFFSAIDKANGDYIAISDQDDIWELDKIEKQLDLLKENSILVSGVSRPFSEDGSPIYYDSRIPNHSLIRLIFVGASVPGHTCLFKKELLFFIPDKEKWSLFFMYDQIIHWVGATYGEIAYCDSVIVNNRRYIKAATYTHPAQNYTKSIRNVLVFFLRTFLLYKELRPCMMSYFKNVHTFLSQIPIDSEEKIDAMKMSYYLSNRGFIHFAQSVCFSVKNQNKIFYSVETNKFVSTLRAMFFPVSCSDYFRYLSKGLKK